MSEIESTPTRKKPGPKGPQIVFDLIEVEKLGKLQCSYQECADFLSTPERKITSDLLKHRPDFLTAYIKGSSVGKTGLRRTQFKLAQKSAYMAVWLGKQYLGQTEKIEIPDDRFVNQEIVFKDEPHNPNGRFARFYN